MLHAQCTYLSSRSFEQGHQLGVGTRGHRLVLPPLPALAGVGVGDRGDEAKLSHEIAACNAMRCDVATQNNNMKGQRKKTRMEKTIIKCILTLTL